jgi:hypothetical protein
VDETMSPTPMPVAASSSPGPKSESFTRRRLCQKLAGSTLPHVGIDVVVAKGGPHKEPYTQRAV